jgi:hypothetical protein
MSIATKVKLQNFIDGKFVDAAPIEFEFTVERVERPALMEGRAEGELSGHGR